MIRTSKNNVRHMGHMTILTKIRHHHAFTDNYEILMTYFKNKQRGEKNEQQGEKNEQRGENNKQRRGNNEQIEAFKTTITEQDFYHM